MFAAKQVFQGVGVEAGGLHLTDGLFTSSADFGYLFLLDFQEDAWSTGLWSPAWGHLPACHETVAPTNNTHATGQGLTFELPAASLLHTTSEHVSAEPVSVQPALAEFLAIAQGAGGTNAATLSESWSHLVVHTNAVETPATTPPTSSDLVVDGSYLIGTVPRMIAGVGDLIVDLGNDLLTMQGDARPITFIGALGGSRSFTGNDGDGTYFGTVRADTIVAGSGDDWFHTFGGGDRLTSGGGSDTFFFSAGDLAKDASTEITDFAVGQDHLDLSDVLAAAGAGQTYADIVRVVDQTGGVLVQALVDGQWRDVALLDHVASGVTIDQLLL